jgi:hypothetical protein
VGRGGGEREGARELGSDSEGATGKERGSKREQGSEGARGSKICDSKCKLKFRVY